MVRGRVLYLDGGTRRACRPGETGGAWSALMSGRVLAGIDGYSGGQCPGVYALYLDGGTR